MATFTKKKKIAVLAAALVIITGGAAFAYWTTGGSGTGSASTGTSTDDLVVNQTSEVTGMRPGGAPQGLSGTFDNANASPIYVASVTAEIGDVTPGPGETCDAGDYTLVNPVSTVGVQIPSGDAQGTWGTVDTPTIQFNNKTAENQDDCKGATVEILYTVN
ncbi:hypothetical protein [Nocardioides sp.]|uniref:hypothetical protein n=1 Tax=Nocardioides sp. TaxID=35761 RepID=UPI0031FEDE16|nr:hypothetical protein [Nocardioides sp.]